MKAFKLFTTLISAVDTAAAIKFIVGPPGWAQTLGLNLTEAQDYSKLAARQAKQAGVDTAGKTVLAPRMTHIPNSKTVKIRYGPFNVRGAGNTGGEGMIWNWPTFSVTKPCSDCMLLGMNAGLEYLDGKHANTDTKMWLHHMVFFTVGAGAWDATCTVFGLPHMMVGSVPASSERIFASGNERSTLFFNPKYSNATNLGYPLYPSDRMGLITDLMNMNPDAKDVWLTMYWDYIEGHPKHFAEVKPVWLDVDQCGISEVWGRNAGSKFEIKASPWTANFDGEVVFAAGHLHDGGTEIDILVDGKLVCRSEATYGSDQDALMRSQAAIRGEILPLSTKSDAAPAPAAPATGKSSGGHSHGGGKHIVAMNLCADNKANLKGYPLVPWGIKEVKKGQKWVLRAAYDYSKHDGMRSRGTERMATIMGISVMYVKTPQKRKIN